MANGSYRDSMLQPLREKAPPSGTLTTTTKGEADYNHVFIIGSRFGSLGVASACATALLQSLDHSLERLVTTAPLIEPTAFEVVAAPAGYCQVVWRVVATEPPRNDVLEGCMGRLVPSERDGDARLAVDALAYKIVTAI